MATDFARNLAVVTPHSEVLHRNEDFANYSGYRENSENLNRYNNDLIAMNNNHNAQDEDDDSIAAVASEEDYNDFVDECGRSRGGKDSALSNTFAQGTNMHSYAHDDGQQYRSSAMTAQMHSIPATVNAASRQNLSRPAMVARGKTTPAVSHQRQRQQETEFCYGPGGLVFNMNEPWERSLQRQVNEGIGQPSRENRNVQPSSLFGVVSQHLFQSPHSEPLNSIKKSGQDLHRNRVGETLLLGHTDSRDYAIEVNRDDTSLGTNASSTVPTRMQVIHRSFVNSYLAQQQQMQHLQQNQQNRERAANQHDWEEGNNTRNNHNDKNNVSYSYYHQSNQPELLQSNENVINGMHPNVPAKVKIGDFVKGCRSADESTVSFLTNHFPYDDRDESYQNNNNVDSSWVGQHPPTSNNSRLSGSPHQNSNHVNNSATSQNGRGNGKPVPSGGSEVSLSNRRVSSRNPLHGAQPQQEAPPTSGTSGHGGGVNGNDVSVYSHEYVMRMLEMESGNTSNGKSPPDKDNESNANIPAGAAISNVQFMNAAGAYYTSLAPDPACFCMGYNIWDYVLPPPDNGNGGSNTANVNNGSNRGSPGGRPARRYSLRSSRLPRVDEGIDHNPNNSNSNTTPAVVVDLSSNAGSVPTDWDMNYLRKTTPVKKKTASTTDNTTNNRTKAYIGTTEDCGGPNYCGIHV